ncbi:uncharacterized protein LOC126657483 [Mercurialis annua]|uniref:uncharacterized protein LOC126657483 n=1 Tax=Mercurialis annua TaxID=3986 RepID=UPI00215FE3EE|nr:uncharacterized protein LOC126657483 [Mercurialis annua]
MAAKLAFSSSLITQTHVLPYLLPSYSPLTLVSPKKRVHQFKINASSGEEGGELKPKEKKKFITREQEPEQYWQTAGEREGENPMMTPLPYIIIFGMSTPFVILAIAFVNGWIKVPIR